MKQQNFNVTIFDEYYGYYTQQMTAEKLEQYRREGYDITSVTRI